MTDAPEGRGFAPNEQSIHTQEGTIDCDLGSKEVSILRVTMKNEPYCVTTQEKLLFQWLFPSSLLEQEK